MVHAMSHFTPRPWVPDQVETYVREVAAETAAANPAEVTRTIDALIARNAAIHDRECFNLNPAANVMNPRAEAALAQGLGSRPSLGYPTAKYEMGLEAAERIEVIAASLAAEIFDARFAEIRVSSGAMANLYGFMALTAPGDKIIVPPAEIGGHITHHNTGCAGLYGLEIVYGPVDAAAYTYDLDQLRDQARRERPKLITVGGSLNLFPHPVGAIRAIADAVGALVLFDAAHQCGLIAGKQWANPLDEGAHLMTMSTYKSLGGPAGGLIVTNAPEIAERLDRIAFPGMTANFDVGRCAALALSLLDWRSFGTDYAATMVAVARALAAALHDTGAPVFGVEEGMTQSHQFALAAGALGGGQAAAKKLRAAGFLTSGIGLPVTPVDGDANGLRLGTPEVVRRGVAPDHAGAIAALFSAALKSNAPETLAGETAALRQEFGGLYFIHRDA